MKLLFFLADVQRDPKLQAEFRKDPARLMKRLGLDAGSAKALEQRDVAALGKALQKELANHNPPEPIVLWGGHRIDLKTFSPSSGTRGQTNVTVEATGLWFQQGMTCELKRGTSTIPVTITAVQCDTKTGASSFKGKMSIPADASTGSYKATAESSLTGQSELGNALTVKAQTSKRR